MKRLLALLLTLMLLCGTALAEDTATATQTPSIATLMILQFLLEEDVLGNPTIATAYENNDLILLQCDLLANSVTFSGDGQLVFWQLEGQNLPAAVAMAMCNDYDNIQQNCPDGIPFVIMITYSAEENGSLYIATSEMAAMVLDMLTEQIEMEPQG